LILYSRWFAARLDALKVDLPQEDLLAWAHSKPRKRRRKPNWSFPGARPYTPCEGGAP
jgi:hypothetical protein